MLKQLKQALLAISIACASMIGTADAASRIKLGDCSHPEPRHSNFRHPVGGEFTVIGRNADIIELRFGGCIRDYIRDGRINVDSGTTSEGVRVVAVRHGRRQDLIRVYAVLPNGAICGVFDRIQDGRDIGMSVQNDGSVHVIYGRKKDLAGTMTFKLKSQAWSFLGSRGRKWTVAC